MAYTNLFFYFILCFFSSFMFLVFFNQWSLCTLWSSAFTCEALIWNIFYTYLLGNNFGVFFLIFWLERQLTRWTTEKGNVFFWKGNFFDEIELRRIRLKLGYNLINVINLIFGFLKPLVAFRFSEQNFFHNIEKFLYLSLV